MKRVQLILTALLLIIATSTIAQSTVPNVLNYKNLKSKGPIISDDKISGYYLFYFKEKNDKKNSSYEIALFDDNYNSAKNFEITRPKNTYLVEMVYNGEVFMLFFYEPKNDHL